MEGVQPQGATETLWDRPKVSRVFFSGEWIWYQYELEIY